MKLSADPHLLRQPVHFFAFGFGAGLVPVAPGTAGTLVGLPFVLASAAWGRPFQVATAIVCLAVGIYLCGESARRLDTHDHPAIVWDEITGFMVTMLAVPPTWPWVLAGFVLFRLFDILKPWPIREADHSLGGGLGIMLDDVLAGVFAGLVLWALNTWL